LQNGCGKPWTGPQNARARPWQKPATSNNHPSVTGSPESRAPWTAATSLAPQYAAEAGGILAMVVVPYVFSRAVQQARRNRAEA